MTEPFEEVEGVEEVEEQERRLCPAGQEYVHCAECPVQALCEHCG